MIGEFIIKLFHARTTAHVIHLKTRNYAQHKALNDFYDEIVDLADSLAEAYQGDYGLIEEYPPRYIPFDDPLALMADLSEWIEKNRAKMWDDDDSYLDNIVDEIVALIRQTQYKLRFLK
jgi:ribosomal protein S10